MNYSAMHAAVFIMNSQKDPGEAGMNADVSNWDLQDWNAFYPEIATYKQLNLCMCGQCPNHSAIDWN